jgi:putative FmdB family regulatory protein
LESADIYNFECKEILTETDDAMPIFEYVCRECHHRFEAIVMGAKKANCPKCESRKLDQQISRFAVSGGDKSLDFAGNGGGCTTCGDPRGPGACSLDDMD